MTPINGCAVKHLKLVGVIVGIIAVLVAVNSAIGSGQQRDIMAQVESLEVRTRTLEVTLGRVEERQLMVLKRLDEIKTTLDRGEKKGGGG